MHKTLPTVLVLALSALLVGRTPVRASPPTSPVVSAYGAPELANDLERLIPTLAACRPEGVSGKVGVTVTVDARGGVRSALQRGENSTNSIELSMCLDRTIEAMVPSSRPSTMLFVSIRVVFYADSIRIEDVRIIGTGG